MSDQEQPGWWQASDGKWYPPASQPEVTGPPPPVWGPPPTPPVPPPSGGLPTAAKVALAVVAGIVLLSVLSVVAITALGDDAETSSSSTSSEIADDDGTNDDGTTPSTGAPAGEADVPDGYVVLEGDGVSVAMPESWTSLDSSDTALTAAQMAELFPNLDPAIAQSATALLDQGAVLFAADRSATGFSDNLNILSLPGEVPLSALKAEVRGQLETQLGGTVDSIEEVELPSGPALRVDYRGEVAGTEFHGVQLYVPSDGRTFVITLSSGEALDEVADQLAESFRVE